MGQSLYLCSGSAGFCCWGLGKGRPFPHVKTWRGTAQIPFFGSFSDTWTGDRGTQLLRSSRGGGPRSEATQFMSEVDRFLTGKSPKCLRL